MRPGNDGSPYSGGTSQNYGGHVAGEKFYRIADKGVKKAAGTPSPVARSPKGLEMDRYFSQGEEKARELLGIGPKEIGERRGEIRGQYEDMLGRPSMAASRISEAGQSALRNLMSQQGQRNIQGGIAQGQQLQAKSDFARQAASQEQGDYLSILDKIERQYRGAAGDTARLGSQYASLGVADKPIDNGGGGFFESFLDILS